jgi:gliding motility-associated-like protein
VRIIPFLFIFSFSTSLAQNIAPTVTAQSDPYYCPLTFQPIVTYFDINDPDDTYTDAFYIQISQGFDPNYDQLLLSGSHPNVMTSWNATEAKLTLESSSAGPLMYADLIAAVYDVNFYSSDPNISQSRVFSLTVSQANFLALTGHYYEFIPSTAILWTDAKIAAENMTFYGLQGYLATLTGPEEAFLVGELSPGVGWIGGSDQSTEGVWIWETGPEAGVNFWNGLANGSTPNYAFWNTNEPNNAGNEDYAHITDDSVGLNGSWNDLPNQTAGFGVYEAKGFIVEYGGMPGDPTLTISASTEFSIPQITSVQGDTKCSSEQIELSATTNGGEIYWFDAAANGNLVHTGLTFSPAIAASASFWVSAGINNCNSGIRTEVVAIVLPTPTANTPSNINACDDDNNGVLDFDFDVLISPSVLGSQSAADFEVLYFSSQADADSGNSPISMPFTNTTNPQQIFVRIQNALNADCFDTSSFTVQVFDTPVANTVADLPFCDDGLDGSLTNGQMEVDLSAATPAVLGSQSTTDFAVSYHTSQANADEGTGALPLSYYNTTPFAQTIFVRIENVLNVNCFDTTSFVVEVNPIPNSFNSSLFQCDEDGFVDGFTVFNCHEADEILTGNIAGLSTAFFITLADAQSGVNPINGYNFPNTSNPQIVYARVIDDNTGCFSISELDLEVSTTDVSNAMLVRCDDDGTEDGLASFDLSLADSMVLISAPAGVTITYYLSNQDALLEQNPLVSPFTNTSPYSQIVYARAEDDNACYGISQLLLKVNPLPILDQDQSLIYCLDTYPSTISLNAGVVGGTTGLTFQWSNGETSQNIQVNQAGVYTITVQNSNGCSQSRQITVVDSEIATISNIAVTDASEFNSIAVSVSGNGDYEFSLDNPLGPYQDLGSFQDVLPGLHTVYVRDKNGCGITQEMVSVIGFMKFFTPNDDGFNDTWQIIGVSAQFQPDSKVFIYDRYGKLITQISPLQGGWNGKYKGYNMPASDYWFHATLQDGRVFKGHFSLVR